MWIITLIKPIQIPVTRQVSPNHTIKTPHPQNPKNLRKIPKNPPINLLDVFQVEGNDPAELILPSSSSEVEKTLLGSGRGGF